MKTIAKTLLGAAFLFLVMAAPVALACVQNAVCCTGC
jgi:hypothetical protein